MASICFALLARSFMSLASVTSASRSISLRTDELWGKRRDVNRRDVNLSTIPSESSENSMVSVLLRPEIKGFGKRIIINVDDVVIGGGSEGIVTLVHGSIVKYLPVLKFTLFCAIMIVILTCFHCCVVVGKDIYGLCAVRQREADPSSLSKTMTKTKSMPIGPLAGLKLRLGDPAPAIRSVENVS